MGAVAYGYRSVAYVCSSPWELVTDEAYLVCVLCCIPTLMSNSWPFLKRKAKNRKVENGREILMCFFCSQNPPSHPPTPTPAYRARIVVTGGEKCIHMHIMPGATLAYRWPTPVTFPFKVFFKFLHKLTAGPKAAYKSVSECLKGSAYLGIPTNKLHGNSDGCLVFVSVLPTVTMARLWH